MIQGEFDFTTDSVDFSTVRVEEKSRTYYRVYDNELFIGCVLSYKEKDVYWGCVTVSNLCFGKYSSKEEAIQALVKFSRSKG